MRSLKVMERHFYVDKNLNIIVDIICKTIRIHIKLVLGDNASTLRSILAKDYHSYEYTVF